MYHHAKGERLKSYAWLRASGYVILHFTADDYMYCQVRPQPTSDGANRSMLQSHHADQMMKKLPGRT